MKLDQLKTLFGEFDENVRFEQDLKKKNWFNIGGKTKVFFKANNLNELIKFLKIVNNQEKIFILGEFFFKYGISLSEIFLIPNEIKETFL